MHASEPIARLLWLYAGFSGRSTRSETLYLLLMLAMLGTALFFLVLFLGPGRGEWLLLTIKLLLISPGYALSVRRYHDVGWRGWWALLFVPWSAIDIWRDVQILYPLALPLSPIPPYLAGAALTLATVAFVMLLWKPDEGENRYGPNPRYSPVGEPA